jgi:CRP/FNR family transcriptional regulator
MALLSPSILDRAAKRRVRYRKGFQIYDEGEPSEAMYRVEEGCVRLQVVGADGGRQIIRFVFTGDIFGLSLDVRTSAAEAVTDVELTRYSLKSILELNASSTEVTIALVNEANSFCGELAHHVEKLAHLPATERVIWFFNWLLKKPWQEQGSHRIKVPMNYRDIADYLGLKPETLSRSLKNLKARGYLQRKLRNGVVLGALAATLPMDLPVIDDPILPSTRPAIVMDDGDFAEMKDLESPRPDA